MCVQVTNHYCGAVRVLGLCVLDCRYQGCEEVFSLYLEGATDRGIGFCKNHVAYLGCRDTMFVFARSFSLDWYSAEIFPVVDQGAPRVGPSAVEYGSVTSYIWWQPGFGV